MQYSIKVPGLNQQNMNYVPAALRAVTPYSDILDKSNLLEHDAPHCFLKKHLLSDMLPYDMSKKNRADLRGALKEYDMLLTASLEAINIFATGDLKKFDALVGENACEIRAVWIAIISSENLINVKDLLKNIIYLKDKINSILEGGIISRLMSSGISLRELLEKENLYISMSLEELFVIQSFLLTESKVAVFDIDSAFSLCIKEKSDPKKIKRFGDVSSSFADNLHGRLRKFIAAASVQFVRENAIKTRDEDLIDMLSDQFTIHHNNHLLCTPMFWTYKCLLSVIQCKEIPLIIHAEFFKKESDGYRVVDNEWLLFESIPNENRSLNLTQRAIRESDYNKMACVIQGAVLSQLEGSSAKNQWKQTMLRYPISTVILDGAADHRQYPNSDQDDIIQLLQDHEFETYKSFAKVEGFSLSNPRTFFIQHVYPSQIGAVLAVDKKFVGETEALSI